jgi:hypothetical protein
METECFLWKQMLQHAPQHQYVEYTMQEVQLLVTPQDAQPIPLGSIDFTNVCLNTFYNIPKMHPIEIPPCLRTHEFLGRRYQVTSSHQIPASGLHFIKDASDMKRFSFCGDTKNIKPQDIDEHNLYVISDMVDIISEYRVYFLHGKIYAIEYYNGEPTVFPDIQKIQKANAIYSMQRNYPSSYTMDWMITTNGTFLVEVHPTLFAVGLYTTLLSDNFLDGYRESLDYILRHNTPVIPS